MNHATIQLLAQLLLAAMGAAFLSGLLMAV